jgi:hypothetical protein
MRIGFVLDTEPHRRPIHAGEKFVFGHLQPLCHCRLNNRSIWQQDHEVKLPECTLDRVGEANQPKRNGHCPKFLRFQCSNLYVTKGGHKVGSTFDLDALCAGLGEHRGAADEVGINLGTADACGAWADRMFNVPQLEKAVQDVEDDCQDYERGGRWLIAHNSVKKFDNLRAVFAKSRQAVSRV